MQGPRMRQSGEAYLRNAGLAEIILPATAKAAVAQVFIDQKLAALQTIEAIRMYAGEHDRRLPESLDALATLAPAPDDPVTGRAFAYHLEGNRASLETAATIPGETGPSGGLRFEITMKSK